MSAKNSIFNNYFSKSYSLKFELQSLKESPSFKIRINSLKFELQSLKKTPRLKPEHQVFQSRPLQT
jgi:hypothetical protein